MFNLETFDIKLDTDFIGRNFVYSEEVASTNSLLLEKKNNFKINGTTLLAERQTHGKGRRDSIWYSSKGLNLTFSILLLEKKYLNEKLNLINFAASLSIASAIENLFQLKVELKWPNDVLIRSRKCAGVLLESSSRGDKIESAVVGMGININQTSFPGNYNVEPTSVKAELNQNVERETLLA
jgi:BirA family biotin operon repressor/biotin-[acetyl-CoA-carboxylase] ligase